jgi:ADP-dependent phosphofructokinase/glucokinase
MHGRHRHRRGGGCGPGFRRRVGDREEWLRRLEEYQRDLEQEVADVADLIRRLKEEKPAETTTV